LAFRVEFDIINAEKHHKGDAAMDSQYLNLWKNIVGKIFDRVQITIIW
jgi:hypothetical protein